MKFILIQWCIYIQLYGYNDMKFIQIKIKIQIFEIQIDTMVQIQWYRYNCIDTMIKIKRYEIHVFCIQIEIKIQLIQLIQWYIYNCIDTMIKIKWYEIHTDRDKDTNILNSNWYSDIDTIV